MESFKLDGSEGVFHRSITRLVKDNIFRDPHHFIDPVFSDFFIWDLLLFVIYRAIGSTQNDTLGYEYYLFDERGIDTVLGDKRIYSVQINLQRLNLHFHILQNKCLLLMIGKERVSVILTLFEEPNDLLSDFLDYVDVTG